MMVLKNNSYVEMRSEGSIYVLTLLNSENENSLTSDVVKELLIHLDEIESTSGNCAMVLTSEHPKNWCTGMNLNWFVQQPAQELSTFVTLLEETIFRLAWLNMPTVACISGNCYGAGAIMASAFDFRLMREDRGRFCISAINQKMPISGLMIDVVKLLPNPHAVNELLLTGRALGAVDCLPRNIVDEIHPLPDLETAAIRLGNELATKDRSTYTTIKRSLRQQLSLSNRIQSAA